MKKRVLTLAGGGAKGVLTTTMLCNFQKKVGVPLHEFFDIIIGTSTGAIIGSMLAAGIEIQKIHQMYVENLKTIFTPQNPWYLPWRKVTRPKYDRETVIRAMKKCLDEVGISKYGELKTKFICSSVNVCSKENTFFKSTSEKYKDMLVTEIVKRSFSAPIYFGIISDFSEQTAWADGGSGSTNFPMTEGLLEALSENPSEIEIYAFGTGFSNQTNSFEEVRGWENIDQVWKLFLSDGETLARIQARLDQKNTMTWIDEKYEFVTFHYYDVEISEKLDILDGAKYIQEYINLGNTVEF